MLSRVAERIYWLGRYVERVENTARLVNVASQLLLDLPRGTKLGWKSLIDITGTHEQFYAHYQNSDERNVVKFLLGDRDNHASVLSTLVAARENGRTTREVVPTEGWERINNLYHYVRDNLQQVLTRGGRHDFLQEIIDTCQLLVGQMHSTMSHNAAYQFMRLGRNLERADMTTRIIDVGAANLFPRKSDPLQEIVETRHEDSTPYEDVLWMNILRSMSAYQMYRQFAQDRINGEDVVQFVLQNKEFPRSVIHCLSELESCLVWLPRYDSAVRCVAQAQRRINDAAIAELLKEGLHEFLDEMQIELGEIHDHIAATWFTPDAAA
jgi:uncharacterized alpha-E superfamily protein